MPSFNGPRYIERPSLGLGILPAFVNEPETTTVVTAMTAAGATISARRAKTLNTMIVRLKAKGIWANLTNLYLIGTTEAEWMINIRNPGVNNLTKVGAPVFTANTSVFANGSVANYYDTGIPLTAISQNNHSFGLNYAVAAGGGAQDMGAVDGSTNGISLGVDISGNFTARSMTGLISVNSTGLYYNQGGFFAVNRNGSTSYDFAALGGVRASSSTASIANVSANTIHICHLNGSSSAAPRSISAAFFGTGMTAQQIQDLFVILTRTLDFITTGDVAINEVGYAPQAVTADVVVYGATAMGIIHAYEASRQGKSVAIVGGWRERSLGGMSANGLGFVDFLSPSSLGGLAKYVMARIQTILGTSGANYFIPRYFNRVMRELLDPARTGGRDIQVYWSNGVSSVSKVGARLKSFTTADGRTFTGRYFHDASYEGDLISMAGVSYVTGAEAAGTGHEAGNGWRGDYGDASTVQFAKAGTNYAIDPFVIQGNSGSGLIPGVVPDPGLTVGAAVSDMQAYGFRLTTTTTSARGVPFPATPPPGYNIANYEIILRYMEAVPALVFNDICITNGLPNQTQDINHKSGQSTDCIGRAQDYVGASSYAQRELVWKSHENYTRGLFYLLMYDSSSRVTATMRNSVLNVYYLDALHYLEPHPNDVPFWSGQLYIREFRRILGSLIWTGNDLCATTGSTPRSIKTVAVASYTMDSHYSRQIALNRAGTYRIYSAQGLFDNNAGSSSPLPYEIFLPQKSECENISTSWSVSSTHVAFGAIRMELTGMLSAQSLAIAAKIAMDNSDQALQDVDYPTLRSAILAAPTLTGETAQSLPQVC